MYERDTINTLMVIPSEADRGQLLEIVVANLYFCLKFVLVRKVGNIVCVGKGSIDEIKPKISTLVEKILKYSLNK